MLLAGQKQLEANAQHVIEIVQQEILTGRFDITPEAFSDTLARRIDTNYQVMRTIYGPVLEERLQHRIMDAWQQMLLAGFGTLLSLVAVTILVRKVMQRSRQLASAIHSLEKENQHRQAVEAKLRVAVNIAEKANRAKTQFLANLSHEIRTPLNGVLGMAELLKFSASGAEQADLISQLQCSGNTLKGMLDRILDCTGIEAGLVTLNHEPFQVAETMEIAIRAVKQAADAKGLSLTHSIAPDLPALVMGDSRRLQQVIQELLDNAVKFTPYGEVSVTAATQPPASADQIVLAIEVSDTGIGVPYSMRESMFESFVQADGSITRQFGGNGLGLSIARALITLMGGNLSFRPRPDGGSIFRVSIALTKFDETHL